MRMQKKTQYCLYFDQNNKMPRNKLNQGDERPTL